MQQQKVKPCTRLSPQHQAGQQLSSHSRGRRCLVDLGVAAKCSFNAASPAGLRTLLGGGKGERDEGELKKSRDKREIRKEK